uniref:F-box domain-containing protein n=1 Tax=Meloidogyne hapla TaxID=6305 RepID=A0A1I8BZ04_MELHA
MYVTSFTKSTIQSIHFTNLKKERKLLPSELLDEIIKFLPIDLKWANLRISYKQLLQRSKDILISLHEYFDKYGTTETSLNAIDLALLRFTRVCFGVSSRVIRADYEKFVLSRMNRLYMKNKGDTIDSLKKRVSEMFVIIESLINSLLDLNQIIYARIDIVALMGLEHHFNRVSLRCAEFHVD